MIGTLLDLSAQQPDPPPPSRRRKKDGRIVIAQKAQIIRGKAVMRDLRDVRGVTLHQTACYFGAKDANARHLRALNVHAHMTCFRDGVAVLAYPREMYVYHGHDFCPDTIGQEHEVLCDAEGNPYDVDKLGNRIAPPKDWSWEGVIYAGRKGIESHLEACGNIEYLRLHRQTTNKPACPGHVITREVGLWSCRKFGLRFDPDLTRRDGTPIPKAWLADEPRIA